jgi:hypothetical protein
MSCPAIIHLSLLPRSLLVMGDIVVCHPFIASFVVDGFIIVVVFGIACYDVPKTLLGSEILQYTLWNSKLLTKRGVNLGGSQGNTELYL